MTQWISSPIGRILDVGPDKLRARESVSFNMELEEENLGFISKQTCFEETSCSITFPFDR